MTESVRVVIEKPTTTRMKLTIAISINEEMINILLAILLLYFLITAFHFSAFAIAFFFYLTTNPSQFQ